MSPLNISIDTLKQIQQGQRISESSDKDLAGELFKVYNIIGLRVQHYPDELQDQLLFKYLREFYGHRFKAEILKAFELAILGRLDIQDTNCYDQFSVAYMTKIMEGYRKFTKEIIVNHIEKKEMKSIAMPEPTKDEMIAELKEWSTKDNRIHFYPLYLYDYMQKLGYDVEISQDFLWRACMVRKNELYLNAQNDPSLIKEYGQFCDMLDKGEITGADKMIVISLAKKIIIKKHFDKKD